MRFITGSMTLFGIDFGRALRWWLNGIRQAIPVDWHSFFFRSLPRLEADVSGESLRLTLLINGRCEELLDIKHWREGGLSDDSLTSLVREQGLDDIRKLDFIVYVPESQVLRCNILLPNAARFQLREAVSYQVSRLTPFTADKLYFDAHIEEQGTYADFFTANVALVVREVVDPWVSQIQRLIGIKVQSVSVRDDSMRNKSFHFIRTPRALSAWWSRLNFNGFLVILLLFLAFILPITPIYKQRTLVVERKLHLLELNAGIGDLVEVRNLLEQNIKALSYVLKQREKLVSPLDVLNELSVIVPKDIYLSSINIRGGSVELAGVGVDVVNIIDILNASFLVRDAKFIAPLSRDSRTEKDSFRISFQLSSSGAK